MSNLIPITHKGQRILTTDQLAQVYETDVNNIQANFKRNESHFVEGVHYFKLEGAALKDFKNQPIMSQLVSKHTSQLYLWTERGANRHCKILDTDKAWEQFDHLEETYFKVKENKPTLPQTYAEALRELADAWEENQRMLPKAQYFDNLVDRNLLTSFRDTAKELKIKESAFIAWLLEKKYIYRDHSGKLKPYAEYVPKLFEMKEWTSEKKAGSQTLITPRGRETFRLLLKKQIA
ncbi:Phage-related protein [Desulfitobacterium hafniense]|uniref:Phage-related protein n=1 Tax=Desulfitobacterium hafniense TaxID=49338 RepID=A0A098AVW7_DESHA|nr:phage antirepressor KilAC domain-containing protein [Desulfitobacterium hafniense]CDX00739.1 Phage-related protein [Desulfitobacterium hafniense]